MTHMERMGVRQLQQNAAAAVRRARRGERIEVTDRGRPVAVLVPVAVGNVLDALEAAGRLVRAEGDLLDAGPPVRLPRGAEAPSRRLARARATER
jgi:prevent-host-death family protein